MSGGDSEFCLTPRAQREMEERWDLQREAVRLLDVVVAEWRTDPKSVQCFDLRIVERAATVVARLRALGPE